MLSMSLSLLSGCLGTQFKKESSKVVHHHDYYKDHIQPIFDQKCVACHSCFNSPCQLNLSSYEGVMRGANKISIYDFPKFKARRPTRLYVDANTTKQWRKKGFYDVLDRKEGKSILETLTNDIPGLESQLQKEYHAESSRTCIADTSKVSVASYKASNPGGRMPYGLPKLSMKERKTLSSWIDLGTPGPNTYMLERNAIKKNELSDEIKKWESLFNRKGVQAQLSSRYLYEHLFLASLYFESHPDIFFRLTRSKTVEGPFIEVSTSFPFGDPRGKFTYRLRPITNTIMHKYHIPFPLKEEKLRDWKHDFYEAKWKSVPKVMPPYGRAGANPFKTFAAIPAKARYKFMLEEAGYHVMTFIKGPVCRGQTALNVINDHFWVMFIDPDKDVLSNNQAIYNQVAATTMLPAQAESTLDPFIDFRKKYWKSVKEKFNYMKKESLSRDWIWQGKKENQKGGQGERNNNALLTIYRHFNSAKVLRGLQGRIPKTLWVIDYHIFESIYYNLTASYNVFGPIMHQLHSRLYMEISRIASEDLFLSFLPAKSRIPLREKWNEQVPRDKESLGKKIFDFITAATEKKMKFEYSYQGGSLLSKLELSSTSPKVDFINHVIPQLFTPKQRKPRGYNPIPPELKVIESYSAQKIDLFPDTILIRVEKEDHKDDEVYTLIRNKDHYNVSMMFFEQDRRRKNGDTIDVIAGTATSYANLYVVIPKGRLPEFSKLLNETNSPTKALSIIEKYSISRSHYDFWKYHAWFSKHTHNKLTDELGLLDLNRYMGLQ